MGGMKRAIVLASLAGAIYLTGCEQATAPVTLLPAYRAVSVDGVALPVVIAQTSTLDVRLVGELLEFDGLGARAWRTMFVARVERATGVAFPDTLPQVQAYQIEQHGARVILRPASPCVAILDCSSPDTLFVDGETARLRAAALGGRELRYAPAINPYASRVP